VFFNFAVGKVSASYIAVISWLLSLVAANIDDVTRSAAEAPFRVIGLQQMLIDGQLACYAAVVPVKQFTARDLRSRSKASLHYLL